MNVQHPVFQKDFAAICKANQFTKFAEYIRILRWKRLLYQPLTPNIDIELIDALFWEESDPRLAKRLLQTLLMFPVSEKRMWVSGTNSLQRASTAEEKECALTYMEAWLG